MTDVPLCYMCVKYKLFLCNLDMFDLFMVCPYMANPPNLYSLHRPTNGSIK